jgi:hypothetical protein
LLIGGCELSPNLVVLEFSSRSVGSGAGLSVALSKLESPEVKGSGFGFRLGAVSGVDSSSGAEN